MAEKEKSIRELKRLGAQLVKACVEKQPDLAQIEKLIAEGAYLQYENWKGQTPLGAAITRDHLDVARMLIDKGVPLNKSVRLPSMGYCSPIVAALEKGRQSMAMLFLRSGARPTLDDLAWAADWKKKRSFCFLLDNDDKNSLNYEATIQGSTKNYIMYLAEKFGDPEVEKQAQAAIERSRDRKAATAAAKPRDPRDARIAELEAQVRTLAQSLTAVQAELEDLKDPAPLDKKKLPSPGRN
jgi:ankyrin repeat protein